MSEDINNDKKIYINELQNKLVNIEEIAFKKDSNAKSIFNAYNSQKEENNNQVEKLDTNELGNLINDIKAYDGKGEKKTILLISIKPKCLYKILIKNTLTLKLKQMMFSNSLKPYFQDMIIMKQITLQL